MRRTGLDRHRRIEEPAGDPLDGLVNLFDVGMVLAVAFLIAGLGLAADRDARAPTRPPAADAPGAGQPIPAPTGAPSATGTGEPVGAVYRLPDGRLVLVEGDGRGGDDGATR